METFLSPINWYVKWDEWRQLVALLNLIGPSNLEDSFHWKLESSGGFTTSSLYSALHSGAAKFIYMKGENSGQN